ncbi:hypothetical protein BOW35_01875 [Solemya velum gill symbiont]|uniref:hypothetical protein n=1 Tax=Solemya velum gill symbiont TaxID=2340 RepID=UPI0009965585|nr:hypothetical protein [Solemya velum gill symbiont]OOZ16035.1 hypothetical protein BOW27_01865 [Solemya velum gill symbiont]OOZ20199.1 hypothetical protein BOW29_02575 [Solemya velum gill symbiont]OOZ24049.1 hypothetical protein BOW30_00875 [Solemya velum gill symbiont]OOZ25689.1 hypothetical protein BOW31_00080 [Solemya velum gill symbiont]OOZ30804.1 hypothetical protein BOW33_00870 [Solemya velum gill symbiont]
MRFQSQFQHSPSQHTLLRQLAGKRDRTRKESFFLISELATQGVPEFKTLYARLQQQYTHPDAHAFLEKLRVQWEAIQEIETFQQCLDDAELMRELYQLDKPYFETGKKHQNIALVIFTTMYNNFYFSNLVMLALLRQLGISLLFLKDTSYFNYLNGIPGFSEDFSTSSVSIAEFLRNKGIDDIFITGFSSGGFASLLMSNRIQCCGYLGYSIRSDISEQSKLPTGKYMTEEIKAQLDPDVCVDMVKILTEKDDGVQRKVIYGSESKTDEAHARHLASVPGMQISELKECKHTTPALLLENRRLLEEFKSLIF